MARIMPPRRFKKKSVKRIVEKRVAKAIEEYEKTRADSNNTGGSGSANTRGTVAPDVQGCSYKTFMNGKPHSFSGTEGVVGLKRWFEKMEQVFEICKCAEKRQRKWEDQQGNNYHQQQNRRQEVAKVYVAAPAKGRGYARNLPWCNRCKAHHQPGPFLAKLRRQFATEYDMLWLWEPWALTGGLPELKN
ncbi:hypothetical protein Tco_0318993 [Tanacetum coccineum]